VIAVAAPDDRAIVRCTLAHAWQLAMHARVEGWHAEMELLLAQLVARIGIWHQHGMGAWWS
jgi:hypothetical protein